MPILSQIAGVLLDVVRSETDYSVNAVLAGTESVRVAEGIIELQRVGEQKGNYRSRLTDALDVLGRRDDTAGTVATDSDEKKGDSAGTNRQPVCRQNPHSIGMT